MITLGIWKRFLAGICLGLSITGALFCQDQPPPAADKAGAPPAAESSEDALRKASQNPVASLISVPVQNNSNFNVTPGDRTQDVLNIQPVVPLKLSKDWNLIVRWIMPIVYQPLPAPVPAPQVGVYGLGDMQPTFFFSPSKPSKLIWAVGPVTQLPTATSHYLGQGKLGLGPSLVLLAQPSHWTLGILANNVWSVAGSGSRPAVNQFLLQYFVNYNMKKGWYLSMAPILTANWRGTSGNVWTVPFGGGPGRIMKLGNQPVNIAAQFYANPIRPAGASSWTMRLSIAFLFPKLTPEQEEMMMKAKLKQMEDARSQPKK
jgi:hypothetical protein